MTSSLTLVHLLRDGFQIVGVGNVGHGPLTVFLQKGSYAYKVENPGGVSTPFDHRFSEVVEALHIAKPNQFSVS